MVYPKVTIRDLFETNSSLNKLTLNVSAEICPQNLQSIERQLRLTDLMTTYLTMLVGFSSAVVVFFVEVKTVKNNKGLNQH